jgi:hypothetical protein
MVKCISAACIAILSHRAYLDKDGDAVIEWDVDLEGGTTAGALKESIRTYRLGVMTFVRFLDGQRL